MILKMNFNFNIKDMPEAAQASMCDLTHGYDRHLAFRADAKDVRTIDLSALVDA
jgi:hypothetical protein